MFQFTIPAVLSAAALANALPSVKRQDAGTVEWGKCEFEFGNPFSVEFECGSLTVLLDYSDDSNDATLDLNLVKVKATKDSKLGSILYNPGGPGESGIENMLGGAIQNIQVISGGYYDIVSFDPRGTGRTLPADCSKSNETSAEKRDVKFVTEDMAEVVERKWDGYMQVVEQCSAALADKGKFFGTAFVVRDMMKIVDALEEDGMLRYYGISYGTLLGWTAAAMFPDRIDRMILDGNLNMQEYWSGLDIESSDSVDELITNILDACFKAEDICPLAEYGDTDTVMKAVNEKLEQFKPIPSPEDPGSTIGVADIKMDLLQKTYDPTKFMSFAETIAQFLAGKSEADGEQGSDKSGGDSEDEQAEEWTQSPNNLHAIRCADWPIRVTEASELEGIFEQMQNYTFGDAMSQDFSQCYIWPFQAAEVYEGDFTAKTQHPVLFVNPTWDPVTPIKSARNASAGLEGSVVLEHRGHGHGVFGQASHCTAKYMRDYMVDGTLPEEGTVCEPDMPTFFNMTPAAVLLMKQDEIYPDLIEEAGASKLDVAKLGGDSDGGDGANGTASADESQDTSAASTLRASVVVVAGLVGTLLLSV